MDGISQLHTMARAKRHEPSMPYMTFVMHDHEHEVNFSTMVRQFVDKCLINFTPKVL